MTVSFDQSKKINNPYFDSINQYVDSQNSILGYNKLILRKGLEIKKYYSSNFLVLKTTSINGDRQLFFSNNEFEFNQENRNEFTSSLSNYTLLLFIVQSFELFESFLNATYTQLVNIKSESTVLANIVLKHKPRTNKELIEQMSNISESLRQVFDPPTAVKLHTIEKIRHHAVHNKAMVNMDSKNSINNEYFNKLFEFIELGNGQFEIKPKINYQGEVITDLAQIGLDIYTNLSHDQGYELNLIEV